MRIWAIGTTRNEVDLVRANVMHHLAQGVDRFLLRDNESRDGTQDILRDLARSCPLEWVTHAGAFRQDQLLTELAREASSRGADWVIPIDADEFWCAPGATLREVLRATREDALRVNLVNFIQHRRQCYNTPDALLAMNRTVPEPIGPMERAEELVESETIAYVEHRYHYKWICRALPMLRLGWGSHVATGVGGPTAATNAIVCLHAPLRSFAVLEAKVDADRPAADIDQYFNIAWHLRRWRRLALEGRLEEEWAANSYLDDHLDVYGHRHPVVIDNRLADLVRPWLVSSGSPAPPA